MTQPNPSDALLAGFLTDELSATDRARVEAWLAADPSHHTELERLRGLMRKPTTPSQWNAERAWAKVDAQLSNGIADRAPMKRAHSPSVKPSHPTPWHRNTAWRVAAAVMLTVGAGYLWTRRGPSAPVELRYATTVGETRDVMLPDSTRVALGPLSTLRVVEGYGNASRTVELAGEAWFRVQHDAAKPFSVRAAGTITLDVGTEFTVRAMYGDTIVRVHVFEGAASLRRSDRAPESAVMLRQNDVGILSAGAAEVRVSQANTPSPAWRDGQLAFDSATVEAISSELRRWYAVVVVASDSSILARRVSATLPARDLNEALDILRLALGVDIALRGDTVRFR